jgi:E3 ubiquitin-protein ligase makorin
MSSTICKFYSLGQCSKGSKCPFVHDDSGICLYYQTGDCRFGAKCALKHVKLNKIKSKSVAGSASNLKQKPVKETSSRGISDQFKYSDITKTNADSDILKSNAGSSKPTDGEEQQKSLPFMPPEPFVPVTDRIPLCPFKDYCRYGSECKYSHGLECHICGGKVLHPQASYEEYQGKYASLNHRSFCYLFIYG